MKRAHFHILWLNILLVFTVLFSLESFAQENTKINGIVIDAQTKEPLPFVNIFFEGKNIGTITDDKGKYSIEIQWASNRLGASFVGYVTQIKTINIGKNQVVNFNLEPTTITLNAVIIAAKKGKYRNKNNPAVELIKKVIQNKNLNRKEQLDYYQFKKYEKLEFDLNNITEKFKNKKVFKDYQFIFNYVDTSEINGKPYLPIYLKETNSVVYYRKKVKSKKEHINGVKTIGFNEYIDDEGMGFMMDNMYQDIDVYQNNITLLTNQFVSPISTYAPNIYKFMILDTLDVNGYNCIKLAFQPRNKQDLAFKGNLYVTNDERYAVIKIDMRVTEEINLNFITDLQINQVYSFIDSTAWMLTQDEIVIDFNLTKKGTGIFGKKSVTYDNYQLNTNIPDSIFKGVVNKIYADSFNDKNDAYWKETRITELSEQEENIYEMVDSVQNVPAFKRTMDVLMLFVAGYWNFNKIDIGPVNTFYSFNEIEGLRLRVGGRTSDKLSKTFRLDGFLVYGFKDERYKYSARIMQSLNKKPIRGNPQHTLMMMYQRETNFPGMEMMFINEDNFLLSFKRGVADKIFYYDLFQLEHYKDWSNGISTTITLNHKVQETGGNWSFDFENHTMENIISSEIVTTVRFAPNEKFYQGMDYRTPIISKYPIFQLSYTQGFKDVFSSDYEYSKLKFNFFKRFYISPIGFTNFGVEAGKAFSTAIPYTLLYIHRANQTYSYQLQSYNLMNFLEFVSDEYVAMNFEHHFNGFIMNKIPLFKKLKWRAIISAKGIYGHLSVPNNPEQTAGLMNFPTDGEGNPTTFTLSDKPYVEVSAGMGNIFKFFRIDLVKRVTYLDNPNIQEYGIRARFKFDF